MRGGFTVANQLRWSNLPRVMEEWPPGVGLLHCGNRPIFGHGVTDNGGLRPKWSDRLPQMQLPSLRSHTLENTAIL